MKEEKGCTRVQGGDMIIKRLKTKGAGGKIKNTFSFYGQRHDTHDGLFQLRDIQGVKAEH